MTSILSFLCTTKLANTCKYNYVLQYLGGWANILMYGGPHPYVCVGEGHGPPRPLVTISLIPLYLQILLCRPNYISPPLHAPL